MIWWWYSFLSLPKKFQGRSFLKTDSVDWPRQFPPYRRPVRLYPETLNDERNGMGRAFTALSYPLPRLHISSTAFSNKHLPIPFYGVFTDKHTGPACFYPKRQHRLNSLSDKHHYDHFSFNSELFPKTGSMDIFLIKLSIPSVYNRTLNSVTPAMERGYYWRHIFQQSDFCKCALFIFPLLRRIARTV